MVILKKGAWRILYIKMPALIEVEAAIKPSQQVKDLIRDKTSKRERKHVEARNEGSRRHAFSKKVMETD